MIDIQWNYVVQKKKQKRLKKTENHLSNYVFSQLKSRDFSFQARDWHRVIYSLSSQIASQLNTDLSQSAK